MATKFAQFLEENKIDSRRLLATSKRLERLRPEDRQLKLKKRSKSEAAPAEGEEKAAPRKPHSGRPVTPRLLEAAKLGKPVAGPAKTRLLRALNHMLEQKKQSKVELKALF